MSAIAIVDYDMGNLHSVRKALETVGVNPIITDSPTELAGADAVVLPGVGSFDPAMYQLHARGLVEPIRKAIASGKPFLGICLGMQILFESSEEGKEPGLGVVAGTVRRFRPEPGITIPQMGWNQLEMSASPLWQQLSHQPWVYFVHSYYVDPADLQVRAATVTHGSQTVTAAIAQDNLMAVQFHPEKSSSTGLQILANFVNQVKVSVPC